MSHITATGRTELMEELLKYEERLNMALRTAKICVFEVDLIRQRYTFFENSEDIFGISGDEILNDIRPFGELSAPAYQEAISAYFSHPDDVSVIDHAFQRILSGRTATYQARMKVANMQYIWCKIDVMPIVKEGVPVRMIGVISDIDAMKKRTEFLEEKARLDSFTGLYTKKHAEALIKEVLQTYPQSRHALILMDLDDFKTVNDTLGHDAGDRAIMGISEGLKKFFRKTDIIGRFGGDEFMILISDIPDRSMLAAKLEKYLAFPDNDYQVTKSLGAAICPDDARQYDELFRRADKALYRSKKHRNAYTIYGEL